MWNLLMFNMSSICLCTRMICIQSSKIMSTSTTKATGLARHLLEKADLTEKDAIESKIGTFLRGGLNKSESQVTKHLT